MPWLERAQERVQEEEEEEEEKEEEKKEEEKEEEEEERRRQSCSSDSGGRVHRDCACVGRCIPGGRIASVRLTLSATHVLPLCTDIVEDQDVGCRA